MNRHRIGQEPESRGVEWQEACRLEDLEAGRPTPVRIGTVQVLLVRDGDQVHAVEPLCPHKFSPLAEGDVQDHCLHCPTHDAAFELATGKPRSGDEWAGRLGTFSCRVEAGRVLVGL